MNITLSVCMISYNHEHFIEEALESIINQKTTFPFELIISDDASREDTNEKILKATKNLPKHITLKYFRHQENLGMYQNFEFALNACSGKYLSVCEGDDYWLDNNKLQKQVDFLESNPAFNLVTGYVQQYLDHDKKFIEPHILPSYSFNYKDMLIKNHCSTCTTTFRNFITKETPLKLMPDRGCDYQVWMRALGKTGKAMKFDEVLAVYRRHENSATGVRNKKLSSYSFFVTMAMNKIENAEVWNAYFDSEASCYILKLKVNIYKKLIKVSYDRRKVRGFLLYYFYYLMSQFFLKLSALK